MKMRVLHDLQYGENELLLLSLFFFFPSSTCGNIQLFFFFFFFGKTDFARSRGAVGKRQAYFVPNNFIASK